MKLISRLRRETFVVYNIKRQLFAGVAYGTADRLTYGTAGLLRYGRAGLQAYSPAGQVSGTRFIFPSWSAHYLYFDILYRTIPLHPVAVIPRGHCIWWPSYHVTVKSRGHCIWWPSYSVTVISRGHYIWWPSYPVTSISRGHSIWWPSYHVTGISRSLYLVTVISHDRYI